MKNTLIFLLVSACLMAPLRLVAQDWPQRAVHIVVPSGTGSTPDIVARILADVLNRLTKKPFIVENRAGAGGVIGTDAIAKSAPDGSTIGVGTLGPLVNIMLLKRKMPYDPFRDIAPITIAFSQPSVLAVNSAFNANNLREFITEVKRHPGKYNYGSIGNGSLSHLAMVMIADKNGLDMTHIVYPGTAATVLAAISGQVQTMVLSAMGVMPYAKAGKLKILATMEHSPLLPGVPSLREQGVADFETATWFGIIGPGGLPKSLIHQIHTVLMLTLRDREVAQATANQQMDIVANSPDEFAQIMREELRRWKPIMEKAGVSVD